MRKFLAIVLLGSLIAAAPAAGYDSDAFVGRGVVRAVRSVEGDILLQNNWGFRLIVLASDGEIHDAYGAALELRDLPLGVEVDFVGEYWEGTTLASFLRIRAPEVLASVR